MLKSMQKCPLCQSQNTDICISCGKNISIPCEGRACPQSNEIREWYLNNSYRDVACKNCGSQICKKCRNLKSEDVDHCTRCNDALYCPHVHHLHGIGKCVCGSCLESLLGKECESVECDDCKKKFCNEICLVDNHLIKVHFKCCDMKQRMCPQSCIKFTKNSLRSNRKHHGMNKYFMCKQCRTIVCSVNHARGHRCLTPRPSLPIIS